MQDDRQASPKTKTHDDRLDDSILSLMQHCNLDKVYLFDLYTKLFFATDHIPNNSNVFAVCADMLDIHMDFSCIYGKDKASLEEPSAKALAEKEQPYEVVVQLSDNKTLILQQITQ